MLLDIDTGTTLKEFIIEVLQNRFPDDIVKHRVDDSNPKKMNFSCPICGDSEKKKSKRRGNLYLESNTYKCYNDGCMIFMEIEKFIAKYCHMYGMMPPDVFMSGALNAKVKSKKGKSLLGFLMNESLKDKLIDLEYFADRFSLTRMDDFSLDSMTTNYIKGRYLNDTCAFSEACYHDIKMEKIYIFNKDNISNKILGYSVRSSDPNYYGPKYKMMNYSEINRDICKLHMDEDELNEINTLNNIFNILNIDHNKEMTICEGQFDAMFIDNCIASTGVGKVKDTISIISSTSNKRILLDNDIAGKRESLKLLQNGECVFLWSKLVDDLKKKYPKSISYIKREVTDINKLYELLKGLESNYNTREFNKYISQYFSNSMFDVLDI